MPRRHPPELRAAVLADVPTLGVTGAAKRHKVSKATVSEWANCANVRTVRNEQTADATEIAQEIAERRRVAVKNRLWEIADLASKRELELIQAGSKLRDVVGARTRAIHDAELLAGRATSRTEQLEPLDAEIARLVEDLRTNDHVDA